MALSPEASAHQARRDLSLGSEGPVPDILQRLEGDAGVNVVVAQLGEGPDGAYTVERDVAFILLNSSPPVVRQRFTLAHEFGHHRLHHGDVLDERVRWDATDPKEVAANKFAAEFLLPIGGVNLWFESQQPPSVELATLVRLANAFGISCETALWRVRAAGRISERDADRMKVRIDAHEHWGMRSRLGLVEIVDALSSVQELQVRVPARMADDVLKALEFGIIDRHVAAQRLRIPPEKLGEVTHRREREGE
jgi:Zn-dependent peptidase ImmA (M78 family)